MLICDVLIPELSTLLTFAPPANCLLPTYASATPEMVTLLTRPPSVDGLLMSVLWANAAPLLAIAMPISAAVDALLMRLIFTCLPFLG